MIDFKKGSIYDETGETLGFTSKTLRNGDKVALIVRNGELSFKLNGIPLGTAFQSSAFSTRIVYPCVIIKNRGESVRLVKA